jgi:hypothetical protein
VTRRDWYFGKTGESGEIRGHDTYPRSIRCVIVRKLPVAKLLGRSSSRSALEEEDNGTEGSTPEASARIVGLACRSSSASKAGRANLEWGKGTAGGRALLLDSMSAQSNALPFPGMDLRKRNMALPRVNIVKAGEALIVE